MRERRAESRREYLNQLRRLKELKLKESGRTGVLAEIGAGAAAKRELGSRERFVRKQEKSDIFRERLTDKEARRAAIESQVDGSFDPDAEIDDLSTRFMAARSNLPEEKAIDVREGIPGADVKLVDVFGEKEVVAKVPGSEGFVSLDQGGMNFGDIGGAAGTLINEENVLTTLLLSLPGIREAGFLGRAGVATLGEGVGQVAREEGTQRILDRQLDTTEENVERAAFTAPFAAVGEGIGSLLAKGANAIRGGGSIDVGDPARKTIAFAEEEGLERLSAAQAGGSPILRRVESQSGQIARPVKEFREKQDVKSLEFLENFTEKVDPEALSDKELETVIGRSKAAIEKAARPKVDEVDLQEGGIAIQKGIESFKKASSAKNARLYDEARAAAEDVKFDLSEVQQLSKEIQAGVLGKGVSKTRSEDIGLLDEAGAPLSREVTESSAINLRGKLSSDFQAVVNDLNNLDSNVELFRLKGQEFDPFEQLKALRTRLFDLKQPDAGVARLNNEQRLAEELFNKVTKAIENPVGGGERFKQLFKTANTAARERFQILDTTAVIQAAKSDEPATLVSKFARPEKIDSIQVLEQAMPKRRFKQFQDAFKTSLLAEPKKISEVLNSFAKDPKSLNKLLPVPEQKTFRTYSEAIKKLDSEPVRKAIDNQVKLGERAEFLFTRGSEKQLDSFVKNAGGINSKQVKAMRAGLIANIVSKSKKEVDGVTRLDPSAVIKQIKDLENTGMLNKIMDQQMINRLKNFRTYQSFIETTSDTGAQLAVGATAGKISGVISASGFNFASLVGAGLDVMSDGLTGKVLTSPKLTRFLMGTGRDRLKLNDLKTFSTIMSATAADLVNDSTGESKE